jgi:PAS domain S-box-containing protein
MLHAAAMEALRERRFERADELLARHDLDLAQLVHDLRVHQVELELQAEELAASNTRLERSSHRFRQLFESVPEAAFVTDHFGRILDSNRMADDTYGLAPGRFPSPFLPRLAGETDAPRLRALLATAARAGRAVEREVRLGTPSAQVRIADVIAERIDADDDIEDAQDRLVVLVVDVTERHEQQEQLRLLRAAVANLNDAVVITEAWPIDEPGPRITFVNEAFERLTGYSAADVLGRSPRVLQGPTTDRAELDRIRAAIATQSSVRVELSNVDRHGGEYWVELDIVPIPDDRGEATHFVAVERDVTERRRDEERRREAERLEALGRLTGGVAHDFNNLLAVILGYTDLLPTAADDADLHVRAVTAIRTAAERGATLTSRLLSFARRQALQPSGVELSTAITSAFDGYLRGLLGDRAGAVEFSLAEQPLPVELDVAQLENALANLLVNARDATGDDGAIRISTRRERIGEVTAIELGIPAGTYAVATVADEGTGIDEALVPHVFEPFVTTKSETTGTGLGLPMVLGFTRQSGGTTSLHSELGHGTSVEMYFPLTERAPAPPAPSVTTAATGALRDAAVLAVEDDELVRTVVRRQLEQLGCRVLEAGDGPAALAILDGGARVDLVFTDVNLPGGLSGPQLVAAARRRGHRMPVVFTSGFAMDELGSDGRLDADVHLLQKPYRRDDLAAVLEHALATRPAD